MLFSFHKKQLVSMTLKSTLVFFFIFIFTLNNVLAQEYNFLDSLKRCKHKKIEIENKRDMMKRMDQCYLGMKLPDFKVTSISGDTLNTKLMRGKIIIINIWALWCKPCIAELPGLNDIVKKYKDKNVEFIALTRENKESINKFLNQNNRFLFNIVPDAKKIYYRKLDSFGFPRTIIIDKKGIIRKVFSGGINSHKAPELIKENIIPEIEKLLKED